MLFSVFSIFSKQIAQISCRIPVPHMETYLEENGLVPGIKAFVDDNAFADDMPDYVHAGCALYSTVMKWSTMFPSSDPLEHLRDLPRSELTTLKQESWRIAIKTRARLRDPLMEIIYGAIEEQKAAREERTKPNTIGGTHSLQHDAPTRPKKDASEDPYVPSS